MTTINGQIVFPVSDVPFNSKVIDFKQMRSPDTSNGDARKLNNVLSMPYEGFLNSMTEKVSSFNERSFDCILRNPDFNILSLNGTSPVTPAQGSNYEVVSNWFLVNGGGTNNYTITPTAFSTIPPFGTGSLYYLNVNVPTLGSPLYLYNLNYSNSGQFLNESQLSEQTITFSTIIKNNTAFQQKVRFNAYSNSTGMTKNGEGIFLTPNAYELIQTSIQLPSSRGELANPGAYTQFQFSFEDNYGEPMDMDIYYLKAEISDLATPLQLNHVLEQIICSNLT